MNCQYCGTAAAPGQSFCMACGQPLAGSGMEPPAYVAPAAQPARTSRAPLVVLLLSLVVVLAVGGYFAYKRFSAPSPEVAQQAAPPQPEVPVPPAAEPPPPTVPAIPEPAPSPVEQPAPAAAPPAQPVPAVRRTAPAPAVKSLARPNDPEPAPPPTAPEPAPQRPPVVEPATATPQPPAANPPAAPVPARPRVEILKPEAVPTPTPALARPAVPSSGLLMWTGKLEKGGLITINGDRASSGAISQGALPGVPVAIQVEPADAVGVAEAPGPGNGWKRVVLRSRVNRAVVVTIRWNTL